MGPVVEQPVAATPSTAQTATAAAPAAAPPPAPATGGNGAHDATDEDEADPSEVRRQIAAARRNMDPDHQIRRAMDAFLSPTRPNDPPN
jgi:hypothetical protein